MVVDDHPANIKVLSELLTRHGFQVVTATHGEAALLIAEQELPDIILLDVLMPELDGFEVCRRLKASAATQDIPVIFMTALLNPIDKMKGLTVGAVDYITKPLAYEELIARLNIHLKLRHLTKQFAEQNLVLQDEIRSRQIAESALRLSEEKFAKAFRISPEPMMIMTLDRRLIDINDRFGATTGYTTPEVLNQTDDDLELWVNLAERDRIHQALLCLGSVNNQELALRTKTGNIRLMSVSAERIDVGELPCALYMLCDITERKRSEGSLRASESRYRSLAENMTDGIYLISAGLQPLYFNLAMEAIFGRSRDQLLTRYPYNLLDCVHPDDRETVAATFFSGQFQGDRIEGRYRIVRSDGEIRYLRDVLHVVRDQTGQVQNYQGIISDLTAIQQTEAALRASEARYWEIVEAQTELICRFLPDGTLTFVNDAYCRYVGQSRAELVGRSFMPLMAEENEPVVQKIMDALLALSPADRTSVHEYRVIRFDRQIRWQQWTHQAIFDAQNNLLEFQAVGRDIDDRKQAEAALIESQHFIQKLADTAPVMLYVYDFFEKRNVYINREITDSLGYTLDELREMGAALLQILLHPDDWAMSLGRHQQWREAKEGEIFQTEYRMRHKNGDWRYFQCQETLFARTADGFPRQLLGAAVDITAAKQLEEVRRAEEKLHASLQEKEVLLKEIHHRVKNNLQMIYSLLRLQYRRVEDQQAADILLDSQNRIRSIALVHEKLYRSDDLSEIDLTQYIPGLVISLFNSYGTTSTNIDLKTDIDPVYLDIDAAVLCGLIINELVSNSLKYAFPEQQTGEIQVKLQSNLSHMITLTVQDNGIGIPECFDMMQTDSLGLKLVQDLADQLEGHVELNHQQGTEVKITFPGSRT